MKRRAPQAVSLCLIAGLVFPGAQGFPVIAAESETVAETDGGADSETSLNEGTEEASDTETSPEAGVEEASDAETSQKTGAEEASDTKVSPEAEVEDADADAAEEDSVVGELIFAQCEDYVNVRTLPGTDSPVTAKLYNNDSATVVGISDDEEWYIVSSGNAYGYVKAEYFATGEEAEAIAEEVAYNVARVYADELNVRQEASTDSEVIDVAYEYDEIEVVLYGEDWMKVALGNDVYGYVSADYVEYVTYYPVGETLEEEEARLIAEGVLAAEDAVMQTEAAETEAYVEPETYAEAEAAADAGTYVEAETTVETEAYVETETYVETEAAAETESTAQTEAAQTETTAETEVAQTETTAETEAAQTETTAETEAAQAETTAETEATSTESSSSASTGASIASFALQYVGYPYVYGGTSLTEGADCSGFVQTVFANFGIYLSRTAAAQATNGTAVSTDSLQAGDLLFYSSTGDGTIDHVAIYTGSGCIVHAANETRGICTDSAYYSTIICAVRCY